MNPTVGILGTGLIGASIGLGLRGAGKTVFGWDPDAEALDVAASRGAVEPMGGQGELIGAVDLLVLAGPLDSVVATLADLRTDALVTDVAGVKGPVMAAAAGVGRFVGGHPMAGREASGPAAANAALFRGAAWVIVDTQAQPDDAMIVESMVVDLGARVLRMTAAEHDRRVAIVSHLPQVLAAGLLRLAQEEPGALELAAGSFRDLTRVAASDPAAWVDLLSGNAAALDVATAAMGDLLAEVAEAAASDPQRVAAMLEEARAARRELAPPVVALRVALEDKPGELARVGSALASSGVDIRDLQLRHGRHGGGGVLTLSVRPGEDEALRVAVEAEGLEIVS